jgi:biopolymer transport protein ExbD
MKAARRHHPGPYLPFITLADIAWQIIIFFLVAATFVLNNAMTVPLPSAGAAKDEASLPKPVRVEVTETTLTVNGMPVPLPDLELQITGLLSGATTEEQRAVAVHLADDVTFQRNADILYAIQQAGGVVLIAEERRHEDRAQAN